MPAFKKDDNDTGTTTKHQFGVSGYLKPKQKTTKALDRVFETPAQEKARKAKEKKKK